MKKVTALRTLPDRDGRNEDKSGKKDLFKFNLINIITYDSKGPPLFIKENCLRF